MSIRLQLRDIFNEDLDKLFSYKTPMIVLIKDRYLGLLAHLINFCILLYFIIYVIIIQKAYLIEEFSTGPSLVYGSGTSISQNEQEVRVWDAIDMAYPQYDPSAIVISTQISETIYQVKGTCVDYLRPCDNSDECLEGGKCTKGFCEEMGWCGNSTKTYDLEGVENFLIWISGAIEFITLKGGLQMSTMDETKANVYPGSDSNSFLLVDILEKGGIKFSDIKYSGAVVRIRIDWDCDVTWHDSCTPTVTSDRLDDVSGSALGFTYDRFLYYESNNVMYRDYWNITGIKIIVESSGRAYAVTLQSIILNVSSILNLTMLTPKLVDFLMLNILSKRREYRKNKTVSQEDKLENENKEEVDGKNRVSHQEDSQDELTKEDTHTVNRP